MSSGLKVKVFTGVNHQPDPEWQVLAGEQGQQRPEWDASEKDSESDSLKHFPERHTGVPVPSCAWVIDLDLDR